jgi:hypothetical protein
VQFEKRFPAGIPGGRHPVGLDLTSSVNFHVCDFHVNIG